MVSVYIVKAVVEHKAFDDVVKRLNEMGYRDVAKMHVEIRVGTITTKQPLTEKEKDTIVNVFTKQKGKLEGILGLPISYFKIEPVSG